MTKQEIEKAIKNGESVWCCLCENLLEFRSDNMAIFEGQIVGKTEIQKEGVEFLTNNSESFYIPFRELYKIQAEAEHYLHHANITRTDTLPFYTFDEINSKLQEMENGKLYVLIDKPEFLLAIVKNVGVSIIELYANNEKYTFNFNETNFYKAYDECVRLFKGEV